MLLAAKAALQAANRQEKAALCDVLAALLRSITNKALAALNAAAAAAAPATAAAVAVGTGVSQWGPAAPAAAGQAASSAAAAAAAVALGCLYRAVLPSILELIASHDPVPQQVLSAVLLQLQQVSLDVAAASSSAASSPPVRA